MKNPNFRFKRLLPLFILLITMLLFFLFGLDQYLSFAFLKQHRDELVDWTTQHYALTALTFLLCYIVIVALSIPGAVFMTLAGGFLFGIFIGSVLVIMAATLGATLLFLIVRYAFGDWLIKKTSPWIKKMEHGFHKDAFNYLLFLRLIPLFPFWIVNIVAALLKVRLITFIAATLIGIIPGTVVYISVGNGLNHLFEINKTPDLKIIFSPSILLPLIALGILSLLPILYRKYKGKKYE